jgi:ankyrin repeat protein
MLFSAPRSQKTKAKSPEKSKFRTKIGIEIHSYVMQIIVCTDSVWLERLFTMLSPILGDCSLHHYLEESGNGCSVFYDALIMPFKKSQNRMRAEEISNRLWFLLFNTFQRRFPSNTKDILMSETKEGFMLLHAAIATCDSHVDKIITLLKTKGFEVALDKNLRKKTISGFRALSQAIISKSPYRVRKIVMLLQEEGNEAALRDNLDSIDRSAHLVLAQAAMVQNAEVFQIILALLKNKNFETEIQRNILSRSKDGYMILQHAIISENESIVKDTIELLLEKGNEEALRRNLQNFTHRGIGVLVHAFSTQNPVIIYGVLALLQREDAKEALKKNLDNLSFTFFHGILLSKNKALVQSAITVLQLEIEIAKKHLTTRNILGENCLSLAILSYDFDTVKMVDNLLRYTFKEEAEAKILELITEGNVLSRFNRDKALYQLRAYVQSLQEKITQKEFERKAVSMAPNPKIRP